jgi:hypothetical protein
MSLVLFKPLDVNSVDFVIDHLWGVESDEAAAIGLESKTDIKLFAMNRFGDPFAYAVMADGNPVCIGGAAEIAPGRYQLWFMCTDSFRNLYFTITRKIRRMIEIDAAHNGAEEVELFSACCGALAERWFAVLGFSADNDYNNNGNHVKRFYRRFA